MINGWPWITHESRAKEGLELKSSYCKLGVCHLHPTPPGLTEGRENRRRCLLVLYPGHQICQPSPNTVHVPLWCQSPRAQLELSTHDAGWCVDFWTCLLSVKQTDLDIKNKSGPSIIRSLKTHLKKTVMFILCESFQ